MRAIPLSQLFSLLSLLSLTYASPLNNRNGVKDIVDIILAAMNTSVNPCDDFYAYSCGGWISNNPLPPDEDVIFKSISGIEENNQQILRAILETQYNGTLKVDGRLLDFYESCMNTTEVERQGTNPLGTIQTTVSFVTDISSFSDIAGVFQLSGFSPLFGFGPVIDSKNPNVTIAGFTQGGLYLPDPSLYSDVEIMSQYRSHITKMFVLAGYPEAQATIAAKDIVAFESQIAAVTVSQDQLQNPFVTYNKIDLSGLQSIAPQFDWERFFIGIGHPAITQITVDVPSFYKNLAQIISQQNLETLKSYLLWGCFHTMAPYLPQAFVDENFAFYGKVLQGLTEQPPRWETCVELVDQEMGMLLGQYFVQVAFPGTSRAEASTMVQSIEEVMKANLDAIAWMDNTTRANAVLKLSQVSNQIGYPDKFFTYDDLIIEYHRLFGNVLSANNWNFWFSADLIEKTTNKALWEMTPATVNAYYDPTKNGMVFPAGILQTPYFDRTFAAAIYYGGSGVIMGHELTHGFDNSGRDYDGQGVLRNWWEPATSQKFDELTSCVINQFSRFEVLPGVYINGNLTQGENIADMGGTKLSYLALENFIGQEAMKNPSVVPGFTNQKLFFIAYAQGWCSVQTPESLKHQVATNVHSPAKFRVLGPLINHPYFATTFNCPVGSYMNPANKCAIW